MNFPGAFRNPQSAASVGNALCEIDEGGPASLVSYLKPAHQGGRSRAVGLSSLFLDLWVPPALNRKIMMRSLPKVTDYVL